MTTSSSVPNIALVKIQAPALLSIFEQYQRRGENCPMRLVGTILGSVFPVDDPGAGKRQNVLVAEVRHCFPVPHSEFGDQVSINSEYYRSRMELHRKCYGRESHLLGWYSIHFGELEDITSSNAQVTNIEFIRDFFSREAAANGAPVSLNLTVAIKPDGSFIHHVSSCEALSSRPAGAVRSLPKEIPSEISFGVPEAFACAEGVPLTIPLSSLDAVKNEDEHNLARDLGMLHQYIHETQAGIRKDDPAVTRDVQRIFSLMGLKDPESVSAEESIQNMSNFEELMKHLRIQLQRSESLLSNSIV